MKSLRLTRLLQDSVTYDKTQTIDSKIAKQDSAATYSKYVEIIEPKEDESLELSASFEEIEKLN